MLACISKLSGTHRRVPVMCGVVVVLSQQRTGCAVTLSRLFTVLCCHSVGVALRMYVLCWAVLCQRAVPCGLHWVRSALRELQRTACALDCPYFLCGNSWGGMAKPIRDCPGPLTGRGLWGYLHRATTRLHVSVSLSAGVYVHCVGRACEA
jgi:hypothetical protein